MLGLLFFLVAPTSALQTAPTSTSDAKESWPWSRSPPAIPPFSFHFDNMLCSSLDFGHLEGLTVNYPGAVEEARMQGLKLANEKNCRLCNLHGSPRGPKLHLDLTCAARKDLFFDNTATSCIEGNGKLGWDDWSQPCLPCPAGCLGCKSVSLFDPRHAQDRWLECELPAGDVNMLSVPAMPWECEAATEALIGGAKTWCRFRSDLLTTSTNSHTIPDGVSTEWAIKFGAVPCDIDTNGGEELQSLVTAVGTRMKDVFVKENCGVCSVIAGGEQVSLSSPFQYHVPTKDFWGKKIPGPNQWVHAGCAFADLGEVACRSGQGPVGYSHECLPCPVECAKCTASPTKKSFKCDLKQISHSYEQLHRLLTNTKAKVSPLMPPARFNCNKPIHRDCLEGDALCSSEYVNCWNPGMGTTEPPAHVN